MKKSAPGQPGSDASPIRVVLINDDNPGRELESFAWLIDEAAKHKRAQIAAPEASCCPK